MTPLLLLACRREQKTTQDIIHECWKLEVRPDHKISQGMRVKIRSYGCQNLACEEVVMVREGLIGKKVRWEKRWTEHVLIMDEAVALSVTTILIPLEWLQISLLDRFQHYQGRHLLLDITPGLFPRYNQGEAQTDYQLRSDAAKFSKILGGEFVIK
jgi:hypothetical protein